MGNFASRLRESAHGSCVSKATIGNCGNPVHECRGFGPLTRGFLRVGSSLLSDGHLVQGGLPHHILASFRSIREAASDRVSMKEPCL